MLPTVAKEAICAVLQEIQTTQGFDCPALSGTTKPLKDLPNFDSPVSIAATGMVARKLKITIPADVNIFGNEDGVFSIDKTAAMICSIVAETEKEKGVLA